MTYLWDMIEKRVSVKKIGVCRVVSELRRQVLMHGLVVAQTDVVRLLLFVSVAAQRIAHGVLRCWRHHRCGCAAGRWSAHRVGRCTGCLLGRIHVRLLLRLADVLLVANTLVAEPIADLRHLRTQQNKRQMGRVELQTTRSTSWWSAKSSRMGGEGPVLDFLLYRYCLLTL